MTLHGIDLIAIAAMIAGGFAGCYALLWRRLRMMLVDRQLKAADQIGALDDAIRALEARVAEQHMRTSLPKQAEVVQTVESATESEEAGEIAPELEVVIAAAALAAVGPNAVVHSIKPVPSPWTQQGRVLVQGGHNLRVRR
jgi:hypothetical protein